tara:strand:+ start:482 stop:2095 length:1614 start_codon:yes stop_codon:yes gene_type:complete
MTSPFDHTVAVPFRDEARVMRSIVRERGHWLSPMFRDLPLPPDKLPKETHPQTDRESIARGYQIRSNRAIEADSEPVEVALRSEEPAPRPAMRPAVPRVSKLDADKKAEAIARVTALAEELAAKDAKEAARVEAAKNSLEKREAAKARNDKWQAKLEADPALAEARRRSKANSKKAAKERAKQGQGGGGSFAPRPMPNPHRPSTMPTSKDLSEEARRIEEKNAATKSRLEETLARIANRRANRAEQSRIRDAKRKEARHAAKAIRIEEEAKAVEAELRVLIVTEADLVAFQAYMSRSQSNRERYYYVIGKPLDDAEELQKERTVKARLVAKIRANPKFLDSWKSHRDAGFADNADKLAVRAAKQKARRKANAEEREAELVRQGVEIDAQLHALTATPEKRVILERYLRHSVRLNNKERRKDNYKVLEGRKLEVAVVRLKDRLLRRLRVEPTYLDDWNERVRITKAKYEAQLLANVKKDPERYADYRARNNLSKKVARARKNAEKAAAAPKVETESQLFEQLMTIYTEARVEAKRRAK